MSYLVLFFAGMLLCNGIPHLSAGPQGIPFPTPFAKPRGVGNSPSLLNFVWGAVNLFVGVYIVSDHPLTIGLNFDCLALAAGALIIGAYLSHHFGKVRRQSGTSV